MEQEVDYYEMEKTDRLCPLLSVVEMRQFGHLFYCVGEKCMWWHRICQGIEKQSHAEEPKTCSKCGEILIDETDFCPNCGAKMEGEK